MEESFNANRKRIRIDRQSSVSMLLIFQCLSTLFWYISCCTAFTPMKMCCARMKPLAALAYEVGALRLMKRSRHKPRFSHIHFFISEAASFLHQPRQGRLHCKKHLLSQVLFAWWRLMGSPVCGRAGSAGKRATGTFSNTPPFEPIFPICRRRHRPAGGVFFWWRLMGSNHRPHACEACALTS